MATSSRRTAMWNVIQAIEPLDGNVVPVRTIQETRPPEGFGMWLDYLLLLRLGVTNVGLLIWTARGRLCCRGQYEVCLQGNKVSIDHLLRYQMSSLTGSFQDT